MEQMNVATLYKHLYERLKRIDGLNRMYIGKTKNLSDTESRHKAEGYGFTEEIAYGDVNTVNDGEIYLIRKFKASDLNCMNDKDGGGPNEANKIYVSYSCDPIYKSIHDLENGELEWEVVKLVK